MSALHIASVELAGAPAPVVAAPLIVEIARTEAEIVAALDFCNRKYLERYETHWVARPDVLFVAKRDGEIVGTAGLELGRLRERVDSEKYFYLTPRMRAFFEEYRGVLAEFGRYSATDPAASHAVVHGLITYCQAVGIRFLFAWANPSVYGYGKREGVPFWVIDVEVNAEAVRNDTAWIAPPVKFFLRPDPPRLLMAVIPFFDLVNEALAEQYGKRLVLRS